MESVTKAASAAATTVNRALFGESTAREPDNSKNDTVHTQQNRYIPATSDTARPEDYGHGGPTNDSLMREGNNKFTHNELVGRDDGTALGSRFANMGVSDRDRSTDHPSKSSLSAHSTDPSRDVGKASTTAPIDRNHKSAPHYSNDSSMPHTSAIGRRDAPRDHDVHSYNSPSSFGGSRIEPDMSTQASYVDRGDNTTRSAEYASEVGESGAGHPGVVGHESPNHRDESCGLSHATGLQNVISGDRAGVSHGNLFAKPSQNVSSVPTTHGDQFGDKDKEYYEHDKYQHSSSNRMTSQEGLLRPYDESTESLPRGPTRTEVSVNVSSNRNDAFSQGTGLPGHHGTGDVDATRNTNTMSSSNTSTGRANNNMMVDATSVAGTNNPVVGGMGGGPASVVGPSVGAAPSSEDSVNEKDQGAGRPMLESNSNSRTIPNANPTTGRQSVRLIDGHPESSGPKTVPGAKLPSAIATGEGTGTKYVKSTGVAAEGGTFDAAAPGAGVEADRLLGHRQELSSEGKSLAAMGDLDEHHNSTNTIADHHHGKDTFGPDHQTHHDEKPSLKDIIKDKLIPHHK